MAECLASEGWCKMDNLSTSFHLVSVFQRMGDEYTLASPAYPALSQYQAKPGSVIILHDREWTVRLLHCILPYFRERGFVFKTLSQSGLVVT